MNTPIGTPSAESDCRAALVAASRRRYAGAWSSVKRSRSVRQFPAPAASSDGGRLAAIRGQRSQDRSRGRLRATRATPTTAVACRRSRRGRSRAGVPSRESARARGLPEHDSDRDADGVDRDVDRRAVPTRHEDLVDLVADRVQDADQRTPLRSDRSRAARSAPRIAYSVAWASLRRTRSQPPSPVPRSGTDENAKMSAAHTSDGEPLPDERAGHRPMIGSPATTERGEGTRCESGTVPPL